MSSYGMIKSVLSEYGIGWGINRAIYSMKLKVMRVAPFTEKWYEKNTDYPKRLELFQTDVNRLRAFLLNLEETDKTKLICIADKACEGIITGFSSIELNYGNPIDWQLNPLTGKRCDETLKWYRIPDFDRERGDIKVVWEASRFSHFLTFSRAYLLTNEEKYYKAFSVQLQDWLDQNAYGFGANFKCSQECSLRMINTLLAFSIFKERASEADINNVKELIDRCYRKILSNFFYAYKCIKNNHTISELLGMVIGAWCSDNQKQLAKAYKWLDEVIDEQFTYDGGYRQFSFNYQRLVLQDIECLLSISHLIGKQLSKKNIEKIKRAAMLMYQCQDESGDMPNYGSNDGALVFPVTSCEYRDFRPVINTVYALTVGKQLYEPGKHQEELIWFAGDNNWDKCEIQKCSRESLQFREAGLYTLRERNSWVMLVANDYHSRPAHMDQNHVDLWCNGINVLCDAGTFSYASDLGKCLSENGSHNTAVVDGRTQMNARGPFMIYDWTERKTERGNASSIESIISSKNGYVHKRRIEKKDFGYVITDHVNEDYSILYHTPCTVYVNGQVIRIVDKGKELCTITSDGTFEIEKANRSLYYLKSEEITCIRIRGKADCCVNTTIEIKEIKND